jgi:hypothetical protein
VITPDEIVRSLTGSWRLALDKPDAMRFFDVSLDGFWRSFQAIVLIVPAFALTAMADRQATLSDAIADEAFSDGGFFVAKTITLALDWITLPIVLAALAGPLGLKRGYTAYIVARNWTTVLMILPFAAIALLEMLGLISLGIAAFLSIGALAVIFRVSYLVARRALNASLEVAIGIVVLDFLISVALAMTVDRLFFTYP